MTISASLRRQIAERADNHCEYCGLSQAGQEARFHVDHITPVVVGGPTTPDNLVIHQYQSHTTTVVITRSIAAIFGNLRKI